MLLPALLILLAIGGFDAATNADVDLQGNLYVVDRGRNLLVKFSPEGDSLMAVGGRGSGQLQFDEPVAVYARRGSDIYVADRNNHRIQRFDRNLDFVATISARDDVDEHRRFGYPSDVALTRQGDLLVVDSENRRVVRIDALGTVFTSIGGVGAGGGRLIEPSQIEVDGRDFSYVLDGARVAVFDPFGSYVEDLPISLHATARAIAVDRDTLAVVDSAAVTLFSLTSRTIIGAAALATPPNAVALINGRVIILEPARMLVAERP